MVACVKRRSDGGRLCEKEVRVTLWVLLGPWWSSVHSGAWFEVILPVDSLIPVAGGFADESHSSSFSMIQR